MTRIRSSSGLSGAWRQASSRAVGPVLYCGDPHGRFRHILDAGLRTKASAVILLGAIETRRSLDLEFKPLLDEEVVDPDGNATVVVAGELDEPLLQRPLATLEVEGEGE